MTFQIVCFLAGLALHGITALIVLAAMRKAAQSPCLPPPALLEPEDLQDSPAATADAPRCPICNRCGTIWSTDPEGVIHCQTVCCDVVTFLKREWKTTEHGIKYR